MRKRDRKRRPSETLPWVWRRTVPFPPLLSTSLPLWNSRGLELEQSRQRWGGEGRGGEGRPCFIALEP